MPVVEALLIGGSTGLISASGLDSAVIAGTAPAVPSLAVWAVGQVMAEQQTSAVVKASAPDPGAAPPPGPPAVRVSGGRYPPIGAGVLHHAIGTPAAHTPSAPSSSGSAPASPFVIVGGTPADPGGVPVISDGYITGNDDPSREAAGLLLDQDGDLELERTTAVGSESRVGGGRGRSILSVAAGSESASPAAAPVTEVACPGGQGVGRGRGRGRGRATGGARGYRAPRRSPPGQPVSAQPEQEDMASAGSARPGSSAERGGAGATGGSLAHQLASILEGQRERQSRSTERSSEKKESASSSGRSPSGDTKVEMANMAEMITNLKAEVAKMKEEKDWCKLRDVGPRTAIFLLSTIKL